MTTAQKIPSDEQQWLTGSFVDPNGRVFEWRGEIYRTLEPDYAAQWNAWAARGVISDLIRAGLLIESELTHLTTVSGRPVLRHRRVPVISYCHEWLPGMLKDAALVTLEICIRLAERGLTLQDGHPWNLLFDGTKPVYVDASSIVPARDDILWAPYQQFCNFFLFPLYLYAAGRDHEARWLVRDYLDGVTDEDLLMGLPLSFKIRHPRRTLAVAMPHWLGKLFKVLPEELQERFLSFSKRLSAGPALSHVRTKFFESLQRDVQKLKIDAGASQWANYYGTANEHYFHTDLSPVDWQKKREALKRIMDQVGAESVLDVGANTGLYADLASARGARVVACETDVPALAQCYDRARSAQLNILPLVINVFCDSPSPGRGGIALPAPTERLRSDLVMALALIHHVIAIQRVSIVRIIEIMAALSARWLLLEYVPPLKSKVGTSPVSGLDDYTSETLENCLRAHFKSIQSFPSYPEPRKLFLCEK